MPYSFIALALVLIVVIRFLVAADAPVRAKTFVAVVLLVSLVAQFGFPRWHLVALLLQALLGIGLVLYSKLTRGPCNGRP
jgi:uncharacterized membrane protein YhdT